MTMPNTDPNAIQGSPENPPQITSENTEVSSQSAPEAKTALYESGGMKIEDPKELADYARKLEEQIVQRTLQDSTRQGTQYVETVAQNEPTATKTWEDEVEEIFYTNPKEAIAKMRQGIMGEVKKVNNEVDREKKFWKEFYSENPDLKNIERVVSLVVKEKAAEIRPLSIAKAKEFLASESRKLATLVRGTTGTTREDLPSGSAVVVSPGSKHTPAGGVKPAQPKNFVDQVRQLNRRNK